MALESNLEALDQAVHYMVVVLLLGALGIRKQCIRLLCPICRFDSNAAAHAPVTGCLCCMELLRIEVPGFDLFRILPGMYVISSLDSSWFE